VERLRAVMRAATLLQVKTMVRKTHPAAVAPQRGRGGFNVAECRKMSHFGREFENQMSQSGTFDGAEHRWPSKNEGCGFRKVNGVKLGDADALAAEAF